MKRLRNAFITGLLVIAPLFATVHIVLWFVRNVDQTTRNFLTIFLPFDYPGLGVVLGILLILAAGALTQNFIGNWIVQGLDHLIKKIPLGGGLYSAIKKFIETIFNPKSDKFKGVVLVEFPRKGIYSIGFRTGFPDPKLTKKLPQQSLVNVFIPCTPNPTSGFYLIVPEGDLVPVDVSVQEAFRIVISMGIITSGDEIIPA